MWESITNGLYWVAVVSACVSTAFVVVAFTYFYWLQDWFVYRSAKKEIFEYVKKYRDRCTGGANRFVVNIEALQGVFPEYDTDTINRVWLELVTERVVEKDPLDNTWCIR